MGSAIKYILGISLFLYVTICFNNIGVVEKTILEVQNNNSKILYYQMQRIYNRQSDILGLLKFDSTELAVTGEVDAGGME